jgi:hypothetical protein
MLDKGPEIKLSELRVPQPVRDVYIDLRERRLLPLVVLLLVAIAAVPILLGGSSGGSTPVGADGEPGTSITVTGPSGSKKKLIVARSTPGLRDYRRRLESRQAKDPFKQQYVNSPEGAQGGSSGAAEDGGGGGGGGAATTTGGDGGATAPTESSGGGQTVTHTVTRKYYSYAIDVRVVPVSSGAGSSKAKPTVRRRLPELTTLPSRKVPAIVFIGPSKDAKKAIMLVSTDVKSLFGDGVCVLGSDTCQLLALKPGVPETVVYGGREKTFRITLLKMQLLATDKLNRAALGKPKKKKKKKQQQQGQGKATGSQRRIDTALGAGSQPR